MNFLKSFWAPEQSGTYISVKYTALTCGLLHRWAEIHEIPNRIGEDEYHTTVLYSRKIVHRDKVFKTLNPRSLDKTSNVILTKHFFEEMGVKFNAKKLAMFGTALVIVLDAPKLTKAHELLIQQGGSHDFPDYTPHITLSYDVPDSFQWQILPVPPIYFTPEMMSIEPLKLDR